MNRRHWITITVATIALCALAANYRIDVGKVWKSLELQPGCTVLNRDGNDIAAQLDTLDTVTAADLTKIDGITDGTAAANKALVLGAAKEIATITTATITTVNATDIDAGASGTAGTIDVFPSTATSGKLAITAADSAGDTTTTIVNASQAGARTYTIPDAGGNADFVMTAGAQSLGGVKTFTDAPLVGAIDAADSSLAVTGLAAGSGGEITIVGGAASTGDGGAVSLTGGQGSASAKKLGGAVTCTAGTGGTGQEGGIASLIGGTGGTNAHGGPALVTGGAGDGTGNAGDARVTGGPSGNGLTGNGGAAVIMGGEAKSTNGNGGNANLIGGLAAGTGNGGSVNLTGGGSAGGTGTAGGVAIDAGDPNGGTGAAVTIGATNATNVALGRSAGTVTVAGGIRTSVGVGAVAGTGVTLGSEAGDGLYHQTTITLTDVEIALTDEAGVIAYGGLKIYDLPVGAIVVQAAVSDLDVTKSSAGVNLDWDGDFSLGTTTAGNDADLTTTEVDILAKTATPQAAAGATTANGGAATNGYLDGTTTAGAAADVYLNVLVDDADHDVTSTPCNLIFNGTIKLTWFVAGDY